MVKFDIHLRLTFIALFVICKVHAELYGIGYREQELQQAKGSRFEGEDPTGIKWASFAGGTNIFIKGSYFAKISQKNVVMLYSHDLKKTIVAPLLDEDDAFGSNPDQGFIQYRLPSMGNLLGVPQAFLDSYSYMTFDLSVHISDGLQEDYTDKCSSSSLCRITFYKAYTPVVQYLNPPVIYLDSMTEVVFNPKSIMSLIKDLASDELPFINTRVSGNTIDFEFNVDSDTRIHGWTNNNAMGQVGDMPPALDNNVTMLWETGWASEFDSSIQTCSYDNQTCYKVKTVPAIYEISAHSGYSTGGQNLTITGNGFNYGDPWVSVDGVNCTVTQQSKTQLDCTIEAASNVSTTNSSYIGQHGLRRTLVNTTGQWHGIQIVNDTSYSQETDFVRNETLALTLSTPKDEGNYHGNMYKGWFIPPASTNYSFWMACDDYCILKLGQTPALGNDTENVRDIIKIYSWSDWRNYFKSDSQNRTSGKIYLEAGKPYYLEALHVEGGGGDHMSVAVEIESTEMVGHYHSVKERQYLGFMPEDLQFDTVRVTIDNPDDGKYLLSFVNPETLKMNISEQMPANADAGTVKNGVKGFYKDAYDSDINVVLTMYDSTGNETTNSTESVKNVYNITMRKLIGAESTSKIYVAKTTTKSSVKVEYPSEVQLSTAPVIGNFKIKCVDDLGFESTSLSIAWNAGVNTISSKIQEGCAKLYDKITVQNGDLTTLAYYENGRNITINFGGLTADPGQFYIVEDIETPLTGNLTYFKETHSPYSTNLWYDPLPFEMLKTYETEPQILVQIGDLPAVCHNLTCDYVYVEAVGEISAFTFDQTAGTLNLVGSSLPTNITNVTSITFAHSTCTIDESTYSETNIDCTLDRAPVCGDYTPALLTYLGIIPNAGTVATQTVSCSIVSAHPIEALNLIGADNITITGTNFPWDVATSTMTVSFGNTLATVCTPKWSLSTEFVCLTEAFDATADANGVDIPITVTINGQTVTNTLLFSMKPSVKSGMSLTPSSVSPVLKTSVTIQLESDFPFTLSKDDFTVNATNQTNTDISYIRYLKVIDVDDAAKTVVAKFGGAWSGTYDVSVRHAEFGLVQTTALVLDVSSAVTTISRNTASIYGGTLLTFVGTNYGNEFTDNPVQISYNGGLGSTHCYVQSTNSTVIQCRIDDSKTIEDGKVGEAVVFLKTSEESTCEGTKCKMTFTSVLPSLTSAAVEFDTTLNQWIYAVVGEGFTGDASTTELKIGGLDQTAHEWSDTRVSFKLTSLTSTSLSSAKLYFDIGIPENHAIVANATLVTEPKLVSLSISEGSVGGSNITANIQGVGTATSGLELVDSVSGTSLCTKLTVLSYGKVQCQTIAGEIAAGTQFSVKLDSSTYECANTDITKCQYQQLEAGSYPKIAIADISSGDLVLTGTGFFTAEYYANVSFATINADTVQVDSETQVTAAWSKGLPPMDEDTPSLYFDLIESTMSTTHYAKSLNAVQNPILISSSSQGLTTSFAGGQVYKVQSTGLASLMRDYPGTHSITVCENPCVYSDADSTPTEAACILPPVQTAYSNQEFNLTKESVLNSGKYFGSSTTADHGIVFDGNNLNTLDESSSDCHVGMEFREGYVASLSKVKYIVADIAKDKFIDVLAFEASNDGSTYTNLFTVDYNVGSGWNTHEFDSTDLPKYKFYRFKGSAASSCKLNEIQLYGVETIDDSATTYSCTPKLHVASATTDLSPVTYDGSITPLLQSISPRYGNVVGGEEITFTGTGFGTSASDVTIVIDEVACAVTTVTDTEIKCTSGERRGLHDATLDMTISNVGYVSKQGLAFTYANYWSNDATWGGEFSPMDGESIHIPKGLNLLVDIDVSPEINALIVEGSLIFAPHPTDKTHHRKFHAHYIFVSGGTMEVGTAEFPYDSKITITMYGTISDPYLPLYGNKCIGLREATLDMHGAVRQPTWTVMQETAEAGSSTITLKVPVDWQVGEEISIASTSYNSREAEQRTITAITNADTNPVITLDKPLEYRHFAATETYGDKQIDMRAEVGLLTRSVVFKGEDEHTVDNQYGAIIFIHSEGDDSLKARLSYTEFTQVGQAFKVGRYPVHFHLIGTVHESYAQGNAVHTSFNRAFTIHGNEYLRITENVVFNAMGHNIFIEDGIERHNYVARNLIIMTKRSWSLLNTDQTPACFWITNPNNDFIDNHAAGSDRYGYWYDLQKHAIGPSADNSVCPENEKVGEFRNNHAHSMGRYGLRIFHNMIPRKFPCKGIIYDASNTTDPYWQNPLYEANFYNLTSWKNNRNGAIAERVGWVVFNDFKVADNLLAGIEFSLTDEVGDNRAAIKDALIVGKSAGNGQGKLQWASPYGVIAPRTENFNIDTVQFYNFDFNGAAALSTCSHCFHPAATDSGARTIKTQNLWFDATTVTKKIRYQKPQRAMFLDMDGTLTGKGAGSMATKYQKYLESASECEADLDMYDSVLCDPSVKLRRVRFGDYAKRGELKGMSMYILPWDDDIIAAQSNITEYRLNFSAHTDMFWKEKNTDDWALPWVTGHKYKISWGTTGIDFEKMSLTLSERWEEDDKNIIFVHNFTDVRESYLVSAGDQERLNASLPAPVSITDSFNPGDWYFNNDTEYFYVGVNGKNSSDLYSEFKIKLEGVRCVDSCFEIVLDGIDDTNSTEATERLWSDPASWPNGTVPLEGEDVHIEPGWNMTMDLLETPIFGYVEINGILKFSNDSAHNFRSKIITIRAGELHIGSSEYPYLNQTNITLYGAKEDPAKAFDNDIAAVNKFIANINKLSLYGKPRTQTMTRLLAPALKGSTQVQVETGLDLEAGDRLALAPTSFDALASDQVFVVSYDNTTGLVTLDSKLNHYHWGQANSTSSKYNGYDIRGEVLILSRNIKIIGEDIESWGAQVITSDTLDVNINTGEVNIRSGSTILQNVEIYNASQHFTERSALRFEGAIGGHSSVVNCSVHNGLGWSFSIYKSANIHVEGNIFFIAKPIGFRVDTATNVTIKGNFVGHVTERIVEGGGGFIDKWGAFLICSLEGTKCKDVFVTDNIAAGSAYAGFIAPSHDCGDQATQQYFRNNVAHSIDSPTSQGGTGIITYTNMAISSHSTCLESSNNAAYKCTLNGFFSIPQTNHAIVQNMTVMDNAQGFGTRIGTGDRKDGLIEMKKNIIMGETLIPDCPDTSNGDYCIKIDKYAMVPGGFAQKEKALHITMPAFFPYWKYEPQNWAGLTHFTDNKISDFGGKTMYGMKSVAIGSAPWDSDITQPTYFYDNEFMDVDDESFAWLSSPDPDWADVSDCGNFPCTGPYNVLNSFHRTKWSGKVPSEQRSTFMLIGNNPGFSPYIDKCEFKEKWNSYVCNEPKLSQLIFESGDFDFMDRAMQPIIFTEEGTEQANTINAYMDHIWDGFYTGQVRLSRFPVIIEAKRGKVYDVTFTGTPAANLTWKLVAEEPDAGVMVRIAYPSAQSRAIEVNGELIEYNKWDKKLNQYSPITFSFCGENRYIGVKNILEFYITSGCTLYIKPRDAIQSMVRMEWTMDEFFSSGGTTTFVDNVAGALGIHASQIKVVSVYEGSLVINYDIVVAEGADKSSLAAIESQQTEMFATGKMDLGAPILDVVAGDKSVVSDGTVSAEGYAPIVITKTAMNTNLDETAKEKRDSGVFRPNLPTYIDQQTIYQNVTVKKVVEVNEDEREKIYIKKADDGTTSWIIITSAVVLLAAVLTGLVVRFLYLQSQKDVIEAEVRRKRKEDLDNEIEMDSAVKGLNSDVKAPKGRNKGDEQFTQIQPMDQYQQQYDPNNDFAIFSVGNDAMGGVQNMQEKMNLADVNQVYSSSDEEEEVKNQEDNNKLKLPVRPSSQGLNNSPNVSQRSDQALVHSRDNSLSLPSIYNTRNADQSFTVEVENVDEKENALPEDQEIQEEEEEEEEEDV